MRKHTTLEIVKYLEATCGELILQWHNFTNCGVRHIQDPITFTITLDQLQYTAALKSIAHPAMKGANLEDVVPYDLF